MGIFSLVGSIIGGGSQKKAASKAAAYQTQAAQQAIDGLNSQFATTQENFSPFISTGTSALSGVADLLGVSGDAGAQSLAIENLKNSPTYEALMRNGENSILSNASATGGLRGGNVQSSLANFGTDTLANLIQQQIGNLGGLANMGLSSTTALGQLGANNANSIADLLTQKGQAQAGAALTKGGINAGIWNNVGSTLDSFGKTISGGGSVLSALKGLF